MSPEVIMGIDAAWTSAQASGVALLQSDGDGWKCLAAAPSYEAFVRLRNGSAIQWEERHRGGVPNATELVAAAHRLSPHPILVVGADIPLSLTEIVGRRVADNEITRTFGARYCGTHSPSATRPGALSVQIREGFAAAGFPLKTKASGSVATPALIETYPHPALLTLCDAPLRVQYKVAKWRRYWPGAKPKEAVHLLLEQFRRIVRALCDNGVRGLVLPFDLGEDFLSPTRLKPFEDALDAVVSAWVGVTYRNGRAQAFGDDSAAIWVPAHGC